MGEEHIDITDDLSEPQATEASTKEGPYASYLLNRNRSLEMRTSTVRDVVDGRYLVHGQESLRAFDAPLAKAYGASSKKASSSAAAPLYALVFSKQYPLRLAVINRLRGQIIPNFSNVCAAEVIPLSILPGRHFVAIVERPKGISLRAHLEKSGALKEDFIRRRLVPGLIAAIRAFETMGIAHGRINLDNIYITPEGEITLGECVSEMPGYSQPVIYETLDRAVAMPLGRGTPDIASDCYAMGVVVAFMLAGRNKFDGVSEEELVRRKCEEGTYKMVAEHLRCSAHTHDLLRGLLNDKKKDAWSTDVIEEWMRGKSFNLVATSLQSDAVRSVVFNGREYTNRKLLVHDLHTHWQEAKKFIRTDALVKWIQRGLRDEDLSDHVEHTLRHSRKAGNATTHTPDDDTLMQVLLLLDPEGPLRVRGFSAHLDGIGPLLAFAYANDRQAIIQSVRDILVFAVVREWERLSPRITRREVQSELFCLQRATDLFGKKGVGFGLDRCLYELNPTLPCQSRVLLEDNVMNVTEFLSFFDQYPERMSDAIVDAHMAVFIASRVELVAQMRIKSLNSFPHLAKDWGIQVTGLLHLAQQRSGLKQLSRLCERLGELLLPVVETLHSKSLQATIIERLKESARRGNITLLLKAVTDPEILVRDHVGFKRAVNEYRSIEMSVTKLQDRRTVTKAGYRYGLQFCVVFSFIIASIVVTILILKIF